MTSIQNTLQWPPRKVQVHDDGSMRPFQQDSLEMALGLGTGTERYHLHVSKGLGWAPKI